MSDRVTTDADVTEPVKPPRRARRAILFSIGGVLTVGAVAAVIVLAQPPTAASPETQQPQVETATVIRGDLTEELRAQGTLAYSAPRDLGTELAGTITGIRPGGTIVAAGQELFRVDDGPVILMHGDLPVWRPFASGMSDGADVRQLEQNLAALGFFDREPDTEFAWSTENAITKWQKLLGIEQTGVIEAGRIVFAPGDIRIAEPKVAIGDASGAAVVSVTSTSKEVTAFIDTARQDLAPAGATVTVLLPGGAETSGTVLTAGSPVEKDGATGKTMKVPLTITLTDPEAGAAFDNVSVSLLLTETRATDVLLIPVGALLAQPGGGFAVERATGKLVTVKLGTFASGRVAVVGGTLAEGDTIVVAT